MPFEKNMKADEKIERLRRLLEKNGLSAWIINGSDPHSSEYCADYWKEREFISGFTGSAGVIVITMKEALIWVDSRYFIQCAHQIEGTCFEMRKTDGPDASSYMDYLKSVFKNDEKIGIASETLMLSEFRDLQRKNINVVPFENLLSSVWKDRPALPETPIRELGIDTAGENVKSKIETVRKKIRESGATYHLVTVLDDIAWLLNLRASDLKYTPVFYSYLLIGIEDVILFTSEKRFENTDISGFCFKIKKYEDIFAELEKIKGTVIYDPKYLNMGLFKALSSCTPIEHIEFPTMFKAVKNKTEQKSLGLAHVKDGVALVRLMSYLEKHGKEQTELSVAEKLEEFKKIDKSYEGPSFETISAFAEHGAIVHYGVDETSNVKTDKDGLLVLDCGSQYPAGTTDVTRTLLFGKATKEQQRDYTAVLKGHIALSSAVFPQGTSGLQLDALAHVQIWKHKANYWHGTGHGVGFNLSVHENYQRISAKGNGIAFKEGMVVSNEPGIYKEGRYGIRIENLLLTEQAEKNEFGQFLKFSPLTLCPFERKLIKRSMLCREEKKFINSYHRNVRRKLKKFLNKEERAYLRKATRILLFP